MWEFIQNTWVSFIGLMVFYWEFAIDCWNSMGPLEYAIVLGLIALGGFLLMQKGPKRI
ncbi:hypothetical protein [Calycomorphotria hydatis]|uniref:Uncharacterized protein n=1 Tax=Calycomorphotria hydatis TaxID=2528027 RepID=A0A517T8F4_9PLAN|nr:hypothetical protein [Calycomorphotria hydatis]QDT64652.1 hypothetical protein V22_18920 [Calycomorphotria hydatis]